MSGIGSKDGFPVTHAGNDAEEGEFADTCDPDPIGKLRIFKKDLFTTKPGHSPFLPDLR